MTGMGGMALEIGTLCPGARNRCKKQAMGYDAVFDENGIIESSSVKKSLDDQPNKTTPDLILMAFPILRLPSNQTIELLSRIKILPKCIVFDLDDTL